MKIIVFLQGTVIMHKNAAGFSREKIIQQVKEQEESVRDFANYIPIGDASQKLQEWVKWGAEICYMSALTESKKARGDELVGKEGLQADETVLRRHRFPNGVIYHRMPGEDYWNVIERVMPSPDVLIEDDCESIGGVSEMIYPSIRSDLKSKGTSAKVAFDAGRDPARAKTSSRNEGVSGGYVEFREDVCSRAGTLSGAKWTFAEVPKIKSVVVKEFEGIDHLPDDPRLL